MHVRGVAGDSRLAGISCMSTRHLRSVCLLIPWVPWHSAAPPILSPPISSKVQYTVIHFCCHRCKDIVCVCVCARTCVNSPFVVNLLIHVCSRSLVLIVWGKRDYVSLWIYFYWLRGEIFYSCVLMRDSSISSDIFTADARGLEVGLLQCSSYQIGQTWDHKWVARHTMIFRVTPHRMAVGRYLGKYMEVKINRKINVWHGKSTLNSRDYPPNAEL